MKRVEWAAVAVLLVAAGGLRASDPTGIYAVVDKVVFEPKEKDAERVQVWGVFRLAMARSGDAYTPPQRGYLYYTVTDGKKDQCLKEWKDLKRVAGTGQCVSFASRWKDRGHVRPANEKPEKADRYPLGYGIQKVENDDGIAKKLRALPSPSDPEDGTLVPPGEITLHVRKLPGKDQKDLKYVFEIEAPDGTKERSKATVAGDKEAKWTPKMQLKAGKKYRWHVWTEDDAGKKGPATTSQIVTKGRS
jgi:hypothetical protein